MKNGFEEVLQFRKYLIIISCLFNLESGTLFDCFLSKASRGFEIHHIKLIEADKSQGILHHKSFSNHIYVDFIRLRFADVILPYLRRFDRVKNTNFVKIGNKVSNKIVTAVCR